MRQCLLASLHRSFNTFSVELNNSFIESSTAALVAQLTTSERQAYSDSLLGALSCVGD